jgi:flagellin-like hook-associated protein FlgL
MPAFYPVGTQRVSDMGLQKRLLTQFEFDRSELLRLQDQLSTGYRVSAPSQDPAAATRAIALQRLLEHKAQAMTNLADAQSYLASADNALNGIADIISRVNANALSAVNVGTSDVEREAIRVEIQAAVERLLHVGNQEYRGRSLFAGTKAGTQPFAFVGNYVAYSGNEERLASFVDLGFLTDTGLTGAEVFGAISPEVRGTVSLEPVLTQQTRLADLRGGAGLTEGSIWISDSNSFSIVDLSGAETIGDVIQLIHDNPPAGRHLEVRLTATGLSLDLDDAGGGSLTVRDLPGGTTARELGLVQTNGSGVLPLISGDLTPRLQLTTRLQDCLGVRAQCVLQLDGAGNDLVVSAAENGTDANGVEIRLVDTLSSGDNANATYNPVTRILEIQIDDGKTTANTVAEAINATGLFFAELDNQLDDLNTGVGTVEASAGHFLAGGSGTTLDLAAGLQIVNLDETHVVTFEDVVTVEDLLNRLNFAGAGVLASINEAGTGIDVRSVISGCDFAIGENGGILATQLGLRSSHAATPLAELNYGDGVTDGTGTDFVIQRKDGVALDIDVSSASTLSDVLQLINGHAGNGDGALVARLAEFGNGIELLDYSAGAGSLTITRGTGFAAWDLGLIARGEDSATGAAVVTPGGPADQILGRDTAVLETKGVFNTLIRLDNAIADNDLPQIERTLAMLSDDFDRLNFSRSDLGARGQVLDAISERLDDEDVELRKALSDEIDADMVQMISDLAARQANMEASLRLIGKSLDLTLLNFI